MSVPAPGPCRSPSRFGAALGLAAGVLVGLAGCSDGLFFPGPDAGPGGIQLVLPSMAELGTGADTGIQGAFARVDRVQATVTPADASAPIASALVEVSSASSEIRISLPVPLTGPELSVVVRLELRAGAVPLFRGEASIILVRGENPSFELTPTPIPAGIVLGESPLPFESIGDTARVSASVAFATGEPIAGLAVTWTTRDPQVVTVSPAGLVRAVGPGTTTLEARYTGLAEDMEASVALRPVSLSIDPPEAALVEGDVLSAAVRARDARNNVFDPGPATWSTDDVRVASVSAAGAITGIAPGQTVLRARIGSLEAEAPVHVRARAAQIVVSASTTEIGLLDLLMLSAAVTDIRGDPVVPPGVTWSSSDASVATVSSFGQAQGRSPGVAEITAERDGVSGAIAVTVVRRPASIEVSPASAVMGPEEILTFSAQVLDGLGEPLPDAQVIWSSSDPGIVSIDPSTGEAQSVEVGSAQIIAESGGATGTAEVFVGVSPPLLFDLQGYRESGPPPGSLWGYFQAAVEPYGIPGFVRFSLSGDPDLPPVAIRDEPFSGSEPFEYLQTPSMNLSDLVSVPGEYTLLAQAFNALGGSGLLQVSFDLLPPPVIGEAVYTASPDAGIRVTWSYPLGVGPDVYFVVEIEEGGTWFYSGSSSTLQYIDPEFGPEGTYNYRVQACASESSTCSPFSEAVTYAAPQPAAPLSAPPPTADPAPAASPPTRLSGPGLRESSGR